MVDKKLQIVYKSKEGGIEITDSYFTFSYASPYMSRSFDQFCFLYSVHIGIHKHAVDRLAKNRRKDIKLLDTKLSVSRGAHSHMFD